MSLENNAEMGFFSKMCKTYMIILTVINQTPTKPPASQDIDPASPHKPNPAVCPYA